MQPCAIIVPARLGSQRFPRKLLQKVRGRPLILWTADNIRRIAPELPLYFAVAEKELVEPLRAAGYSCIMTDPALPSGTDRIAAANKDIQAERVINVQADEPVLATEHIRQLLDVLEGGAEMATLATHFNGLEEFRDPNKVKVVTDLEGRALYFSRAPIPYNRDGSGFLPERAYWHLGLYGYTRGLLEEFQNWSQTYLEKIEKLEQLRMLEHGKHIGVGISETRTVGVDVPDDLQRLDAYLETR